MTVTTRLLTPDDAAVLDAFLAPHTAEAYYLRSNAIAAGLVFEDKPLQAEYFGAFQDGRLVGALSYSWINTILVYVDSRDSLPLLVEAVRPSILKRGGALDAVLGLAPLVEDIVEKLGIPQQAFRRYDNEGLFCIDLNRLHLPPMPEGHSLRLAGEGDRALLVDWRMAFNIEANNAAAGPSLKKAVEKEVDHWLKSKNTYLLEKSGVPVSFCGIGGSISDIVIIGPVWTSADSRNRGYGRLVTGHGLNSLRQSRPALREATLFASRPDAIRMYQSLGFSRVADWGLAMLREDYRVGGLHSRGWQ